MTLSNDEWAVLLGRTPAGREPKPELTRPWVQYTVAAERMCSTGRDAVVTPFGMGRTGAAPSCGSSEVGLCGGLHIALAVRVESAEKAPGVTLGKLGMLRDELTGRLEALVPKNAVRHPRPGVRAAFAARFKDGT